MSSEKGIAEYLDEYVVEEGIGRFLLDKPITVACTIKEAHLVKTEVIFISKRRKGTYVFCPIHHDFFNIARKKQ